MEEEKIYGLDKPALTVIIEAEDEEGAYSLLIGAEVKDQSGSRYARLANKATVFVLSAEDVQLLQKGLLFEKD